MLCLGCEILAKSFFKYLSYSSFLYRTWALDYIYVFFIITLRLLLLVKLKQSLPVENTSMLFCACRWDLYWQFLNFELYRTFFQWNTETQNKKGGTMRGLDRLLFIVLSGPCTKDYQIHNCFNPISLSLSFGMLFKSYLKKCLIKKKKTPEIFMLT